MLEWMGQNSPNCPVATQMVFPKSRRELLCVDELRLHHPSETQRNDSIPPFFGGAPPPPPTPNGFDCRFTALRFLDFVRPQYVSESHL